VGIPLPPPLFCDCPAHLASLPLQVINPSETFGEIVVDYNHVECSSACITALTAFTQAQPQHRAAEIAAALRKGIKYLKRCAGVGGRVGDMG
jgi:cycloartenol synthase